MTKARPFRFGVVAESAPSREAWIELVRRSEDLGYATFLLADHYVNEFPPIAALMAAADAASTIRIGSIVFNNDFRHPVLLAKEVATLDLLSGGRFELGIGAGWHRPEYEQIGLPFESAGIRISRLEEALSIIKQFFTKETVTFAGNHYTVTNLQAFPKPLQRPHPPIFMGGGGKRLLSLAGREADIIGLHLKVMELNLLLGGVVITENPQQAAEQRIQEIGRPGVTAEQLLANPYLLIGSAEQLAERMQRWRDQFGISYLVVGTEDMEAFAPVVARLTSA